MNNISQSEHLNSFGWNREHVDLLTNGFGWNREHVDLLTKLSNEFKALAEVISVSSLGKLLGYLLFRTAVGEALLQTRVPTSSLVVRSMINDGSSLLAGMHMG